jgi:hypothetical protein
MNDEKNANKVVDQMIDEVVFTNPYQLIQEATSLPKAPKIYIERERENGHHRLWNDYFAENSLFLSYMFRRRFRMQKHVFLRIVDAMSTNYAYFQQRLDATSRLSASSLLKCTATIRMLAYGIAADAVEDYLRISATMARDTLANFVEGVVSQFGAEYLRKPNEIDLARLLYVGEQRGFPGMTGSIDCMHWVWKNCPARWKGQFAGRNKDPTLVLEAVASYDLWI